jgi:predicted amidohydrolase
MPGVIDCHVHMFEYGTWNGLPKDLAGIPMGVTGMIDAGSAGVAGYKSLVRQLKAGKMRGRMMLNVSGFGIIMPSQFPEPVDPSVWNIKLFEKAFSGYGEYIIGLKLRTSRGVVGSLGLEPLKKTVELAEHLKTRVIVHVTDAPESMSTVAGLLRKGDVFCHVFHGTGPTILTKDGKIEEGILEARKRGVIFDVASGRGNFSLNVAQKAIAEGFLPDSISTDVTLQNWHNSIAGHMPQVMSRMLAAGMTLEDVVRCSTFEPAKQLGIDGLGTLKAGTPADITVMKLEDVDKTFVDRDGYKVAAKQEFIPKGTVIGGEMLYRAVELELV